MDHNDDDVFQGSGGPVIVDCDVLEAAKENVQPLGTGRRVTALSAILATPHAQREAKLSATRNRLRINVEIALDDDEDGDALEAYWQFVNWTLDNYPQGHSAESGLLELLEEATRVLKDHNGGVWRGDIKYLKLWLLYASYVEKPVVIYKFLIANEIGTGFALLYEEYAAVLERDNRRKEADDAYSLGLARRAAPLDRLQERYNDFQKRMMSNMMLPPASSTTSQQKPRQALTTTSLRPPAAAAAAAPSSSSRLPSSRSVSNPAPMSSSLSNSRLQIFTDPTGAEAESSTAVAAAASTAWQDLGTRKTRIKENVPEVKKLAGTTLKQAGKSKRIASASASASSSSSKIAVYRDPGNEEMMPPPPSLPTSKTKVSTKTAGTTTTATTGTSRAEAPPKTPARSTFVPFVDSNTGQDDHDHLPPVTPRFTPFRDETSISGDGIAVGAGVVSPTNAVTESVIKVKKAGLKGPNPTSSEAEALRKDPLKNYPDTGRVVD